MDVFCLKVLKGNSNANLRFVLSHKRLLPEVPVRRFYYIWSAMSGNTYTKINTSENFEFYEFISEGRSPLNKIVRFELVDEKEQIYNLVLCTVLSDGTEDCNSASRNGDMNKVLETVAQIAKIFSDQYPKRKIFVTGSDMARTRQYRIKIALFYQLITDFFEVEGVVMENFQIISRERFRPRIDYNGFILTRKRN